MSLFLPKLPRDDLEDLLLRLLPRGEKEPFLEPRPLELALLLLELNFPGLCRLGLCRLGLPFRAPLADLPSAGTA